MSFLIPSIRHAFPTPRTISPSILRQQRVSGLNPFRPRIVQLVGRPYSQPTGPNSPPPSEDKSSTPQSSETVEDSIDSPAKEESVPESRTTSDPFSGDLSAAPGSLLAEYTTPAEEGRQVQPSAGGSGVPPLREEYKSSADRRRERVAKFFGYAFLLGVVGGSIYMGSPLDREERGRFGWGDVITLPHLFNLTSNVIVTVRTFSHCILEATPSSWEIYAPSNFQS
jgi:hypothetical protein